MVHPLLTATFDLFLIGGASSIIAAMAVERFAKRGPAVGAAHRARVASTVIRARRVPLAQRPVVQIYRPRTARRAA